MDTLHEVPLHAEKIGVWCAVSRRGNVGPLIFESTLDGAVRGLGQQFMALLELHEMTVGFSKTCNLPHC
jgi:hypothetical protein